MEILIIKNSSKCEKLENRLSEWKRFNNEDHQFVKKNQKMKI